jgi:hypothetical protein
MQRVPRRTAGPGRLLDAMLCYDTVLYYHTMDSLIPFYGRRFLEPRRAAPRARGTAADSGRRPVAWGTRGVG